jgi:hypothetical protein
MKPRTHIGIVVAAAAAASTAPALAAGGEPLVVTQLADPDPNFVPPPEPKHKPQAAPTTPAKQTLADAMEAVGSAAGRLAKLQERARQERKQLHDTVCKTLAAAHESGIDHSDLERDCDL